MKRYFSILTAVAVFSSFGLYLVNSHIGKSIKSESYNLTSKNSQEILNSNNSTQNNQSSQIKKPTKANKSEKIYFALSKKEHLIGSANSKGGNSPESHVFQVLIEQALSQNYQVWLDYELYGLEDYTSVCKSVNDQLSTGGLFVKKQEAWSKQSEQLKSSLIRSGKNIIRFNVPENADYSYKVRNVALRIVPTNNNQTRTLVINQPSTFTYYQKFGYLQGFVVGKGSDKAKLTINGKPVQSLNGIFESIVEKDGVTANIWSANIVAHFEDGEEITQNVIFDKPAQFDFTYNLNNQIHQSDATFTPNSAITLQHDGMKIDGLPQTIATATTITATTLRAIDMPPMGSGMVNVTGMGKGYRLLPHGSKFQKDLTIRMKYDTTMLPIGYKPEDIRTYYFDESANNWIVLPRDTVDLANCEIVSFTNHFTDFINGVIKAPEMPETQAFTPTSIKDIKAANPLEGYNVINPPSANNMGTANLSFPIEVPKGRMGMQPNLSINYSSGGGNSWLGVGWNLTIPAITVETRWGVPRYDGSLETESYLLNGEELIPEVQRTGFETRTTDKQFYPKVEGSFVKIIRHGNSPSTYYWTVTDKNGIESTYGENSDSKLVDANGNIAHWALTKTKDVNGNFVNYECQIIQNAGVANSTVMGKQIYLKKITYTNSNNVVNGKYWVDFNLEDVNDGIRPDVQISGRLGFKEVTAHRLKNIIVNSDWGIIRKYHMVYKNGAFRKTLLCSIVEEDASSLTINDAIKNEFLICGVHEKLFSEVGLKQHRFEYFDEIPSEHFTTEQNITSFSDELRTHTIFGSPSAIGNTRSWDWGAGLGLGVGFGSGVWKNNNSICGRYNYSESYSRGLSMLMDLDGDGLPDKVFFDDNKVYYRNLRKEGTDYAFGNKNQAYGLNNMLTEKSTTNSIGLDAHIGFSDNIALNIAGGFARTESYTARYFADVDGDGLPDFIDDGSVYYNRLISGDRHFTSNNSDTIWVGEGHCKFILNNGTIDSSIVSNDEPNFSFCDTIIHIGKDTIINCYDNSDVYEAVRIWIAPWTGQISINSPIKLIQDTSSNRIQSRTVDGVRCRFQKNNSDFYSDSIACDNYNTHNIRYNNLSVNKGDRIYFRLQSKKSFKFDNVSWSPSIYYIQKGNNSNIDTTITDAEYKPIYTFKSSDDFLLTSKQEIGMPVQGTVKIKGSIIAPALSDSVSFEIYKNGTLFKNKIFVFNNTINYGLDTIIQVDTSDAFTFFIKSNTQLEWSAVKSAFSMYYISTNDTNIVVDSNSLYSNLKFKPIVQYSLFQEDLIPSFPYSFSVGTYSVKPLLTFSSTTSGNIVFAIKKKHKLLAKKKLTIVNGIIQNNNFISFSNGSIDSLYFEFYTDSIHLAQKISNSTVEIQNVFFSAGLHATVSDTMFKFGNLYRNWGQFCYKPKNKLAPIDESKLSPFNSNTVANLDTSFVSGMDSSNVEQAYNNVSNMIANSQIYNPLQSEFSMMNPDMDSLFWKGSIGYTIVGKDIMSNEINVTPLIPVDTTDRYQTSESYDSPIPVQVPGKKVTAIRKYSYSDNYSGSVAIGPSIVNAGFCGTYSKTFMLNDFMDMNGDRLPDIVGKHAIQYSLPQGGLSAALSIPLNDYVNKSSAYSIGKTAGTSFPKNKEIGGPRKGSYTSKGLSVGASGIYGNNRNSRSLFDINGDGLPDYVYDNGNDDYTYNLNIGYKFASNDNWPSTPDIRKGSSLCLNISAGGSIGAGFAPNLAEQLASAGKKGLNKWEFSLALGIGMTFSVDKTNFFFIDMNGDGLQDKVKWEVNSSNRAVIVAFNTGTGFTNFVQWGSFDINNRDNSSFNQNADLSVTFGLFIWGVKFIINPRANIGSSVNISKAQFIDMNNDGYVDLVTSDAEDNLNVYYSTLNKTNLISKVYTPSGSNFAMDYSLSECSQKAPSRNWQLASVNAFDGFVGDGADYSLTTFEYKNPYYDRFERASYGYDTVITHAHNTLNNNQIYRSVVEVYHNSDFLFKGLKKQELLIDNTNNKQVETDYTYNYALVSSGVFVADTMIHCFSGYYPALAQEDKYFYEGASTYTIHTQKKYTHGTFGNIKIYEDFGDVADGYDDVKAVITYDSIPSIHAMALAKNISVYHGSDLLRSRNADYDNLGRLTSITLNHDGNSTVSSYEYDNYGNIVKILQPEDILGESKKIYFKYDDVVKTYPIIIFDESNFESNTDYDFKIGKPTMTRDISGNKLNYTYYLDGRLQTIQAPYENDNGIPYTIMFEYWNNHSHQNIDPDNIPWARTRHYDPANPNNEITTVLFADGLGRPIQTKKKSVVEDNIRMVVSGKVRYDAFGRSDRVWYPITENINSDSIFNTNIDNQPPSINDYDVMDRVISATSPDNKTSLMSFGFGTDQFGATRFKTTLTDALGNKTKQFKDARGLQTTVIDALNGSTAFIYNSLGELQTSIDPEGNPTTHQYDGLGRKIQTIHPDAGTSNFVYDNANNLVSMQTQNLINQSQEINYVYKLKKLIEIHYPQNPEMDVYYKYGAYNEGNNAGKITSQQDASGVQIFGYGKLGELIRNIHTFVVPGGENYTFEMQWQYDSWNRIKSILYSDGEILNYGYNCGGQLANMRSVKTNNTYNFINAIRYDKFGNRLKISYGNGTQSQYTYNPTSLRLSNLKSYNSQNELMQDIDYSYDDVSNITQIKNDAPTMSNGLGGTSRYNYAYDNIYRLETSTGYWKNNNNFSLAMQYSASGNITNKTQYAETSINGALVTIDYDRSYSYNTSQPHTITDINSGDLGFEWDANGNLTRYNNNLENINRKQCWDEENRLIAVSDGRFLSNYLYDAAGERVWKLGGQVQQMLVNGEQYINFADMNENKTLYTNPYMVINDKEYTKHYYIEGQRIASKIGGGLAPSPISYTEVIEPLYKDYEDIRYRLLNMCHRADECTGFNSNNTSYGKELKCISNYALLDNNERELFFYHSDHIGSSSFITDADGYASQHLQYLPFGELFVEQRATANYYTPYKFSGKEKDEETSYSYFGARYYMSDVSVWLSVDPMADQAPGWTPYRYCFQNPIRLIDPNGTFEGDYLNSDGVKIGNDGIDDKKVYRVNTTATSLSKEECLQLKGIYDKGLSGQTVSDPLGGNFQYPEVKLMSLNRDQLFNEARWIYGEGGSIKGDNKENTPDYYAWTIKNASSKLGSLDKVMRAKMLDYNSFMDGTYPGDSYKSFFDAQGEGFDNLYAKIPNAKLVITSIMNAELNITTDPTKGSYGWGAQATKPPINGGRTKVIIHTQFGWHKFGDR